MNTAQAGIFALGTSSHAYLEFNRAGSSESIALVKAMADVREPRTTVGGVNLVAGFRPELWREVAAGDAPPDLAGFNHELKGRDGYVMPATQHDAVLWLSGSSYDVVFDEARAAINALAAVAKISDETSSWSYRRYRDLTGFIDGTKNPSLLDAPDITLIPDGKPGARGTILLMQQWEHDVKAWESLSESEQERVMGRTKPESVELDPLPPDSHVASTDQEKFGNVFRRNMPYGTVTSHGTMFVGFSKEQRFLEAMLESMAGLKDGQRDALTRYTRPVTGAYYFIPSVDAIRRFATRVD
jgi:putative iron-dependent peroxidase